jgi:hypothetical protein
MSMITAAPTGQQLLAAAVAGAQRGYNRSAGDKSTYEFILKDLFDHYNTKASRSIRRNIIKKTKGDWRKAQFPVYFLMFHEHIAGQPSEVHVRVMIPNADIDIIDIPLENWNQFPIVSH